MRFKSIFRSHQIQQSSSPDHYNLCHCFITHKDLISLLMTDGDKIPHTTQWWMRRKALRGSVLPEWIHSCEFQRPYLPGEMEWQKMKPGKSRPMAKREQLTMCVWRGEMGKEVKRERECRKPLAPCLQSAICWWRGSWRGGAQRPFLAMRSSLINKTKRVSCVTPICYLHPCSRTPFISI